MTNPLDIQPIQAEPVAPPDERTVDLYVALVRYPSGKWQPRYGDDSLQGLARVVRGLRNVTAVRYFKVSGLPVEGG